LTRLGGLKEFLLLQEPLLTGFLKIIFQINKIGEFPLVEESFQNLIEVGLHTAISSNTNDIT